MTEEQRAQILPKLLTAVTTELALALDETDRLRRQARDRAREIERWKRLASRLSADARAARAERDALAHQLAELATTAPATSTASRLYAGA